MRKEGTEGMGNGGHKEPVITQPNITTRISMGGRQLQASAKVDHNAVN